MSAEPSPHFIGSTAYTWSSRGRAEARLIEFFRTSSSGDAAHFMAGRKRGRAQAHQSQGSDDDPDDRDGCTLEYGRRYIAFVYVEGPPNCFRDCTGTLSGPVPVEVVLGRSGACM